MKIIAAIEEPAVITKILAISACPLLKSKMVRSQPNGSCEWKLCECSVYYFSNDQKI